ncbi:phosphatase [Psychrobacillus sp. L3]|uniref:phosphatase n=1 Tax=Psychrobacillus sp. L3 TaxID=3236891 RepID=UPI0036F363B6
MTGQAKEELTEEEKLVLSAKREYAREYRKKNKEKINAANQRYWLKKAKEMNR